MDLADASEALSPVPVARIEVCGAVPMGGELCDAALDSAVPLSVAAGDAVGRLDESSVAREEAAPERTLEKPAARELEAPGLVATTLESSELSEEAKLDNALDAAAVTVDGTSVVVLTMLDASESTDEPAEATRLEASAAADGTRPVKLLPAPIPVTDTTGAVPRRPELALAEAVADSEAPAVGEPVP